LEKGKESDILRKMFIAAPKGLAQQWKRPLNANSR